MMASRAKTKPMSLSIFVGRALLRKELRRSAFISTIVNVSERGFATKRRRRPKEVSSKYPSLNETVPQIDHGGISQPFNLSEDTIDDYLNKASLSPWVPVPDPVARKMLELAATGPDDVRSCKIVFSMQKLEHNHMLTLLPTDSHRAGVWRRKGEFSCDQSSFLSQTLHWSGHRRELGFQRGSETQQAASQT